MEPSYKQGICAKMENKNKISEWTHPYSQGNYKIGDFSLVFDETPKIL